MSVAHRFLVVVVDQLRRIALVLMPIMARMGLGFKERLAALGVVGVAVLINTAAQFFSPAVD
jgi:hypothetical protein